jgi:hypothetical protein
MGLGQRLFELAALLISVAFAALLIGHAGGTATVIQAAGGEFNTLLRTVSLQGDSGIPSGYGNAFLQ